MEVPSAEYLAWFVGVPALVGLVVRRWWLLAAGLALFVVWMLVALTTGIVRTDEVGTAGEILLATLYGLLPVEAGLAAGIAVGRLLMALRAPRSTSR